MDFIKTELTDCDIIRPFFAMQSTRICDCTVGSIMMWRNYFETKFAIEDGALFFKIKYGKDKATAFTVPIGMNKKNALEKIKKYCEAENIKPMFCSVTTGDIEIIREVFGDINVKPEREWFDYLYEAENMKTFPGKKLHGQRNHLNRFIKTYPQHEFQPITEENLPQVRNFYKSYVETHEKNSKTAHEESEKVFEVLDNYSTYGLFGGFISVDNDIIAFSLGEKVNDVLFVHVEKAKTEYHGAYQAIVSKFATHFASDEIKYINREEDVGDEGLRKSKLAYKPIRLIEKHVITFNNQ